MKKVHTLLLSMTLSFAMAACTIPALWAKADGATGASNGVTMYRLYNPNSGEHFYTKDESEKNNLVKAGWSDEGIGWIAPEKSNTPVYRLYNANAGDHHYTMDAKERDGLITAGWNDEGTGWYSDDDKTVPLYREYNPNAVTGTHNYTTDKAEHMNLVKAGWKDEGIGWYGTTLPESKYVPGDIVILGSYEQDNDLSNGKEPIEWVVLGERDGKTLLLSKYALDSKQYYREWAEITWEDCLLREWLNNDFYNTAFSAYDKQRIVTAHNENPDSYELYKPWNWNPDSHFGAKGGNATYDKVFLLSWTEARDYFDGEVVKDTVSHAPKAEDYNQKLLCRPTTYAIAQGAWVKPDNTSPNDLDSQEYPSDVVGCCEWLLRSPGQVQQMATGVLFSGGLFTYSVHNSGYGVRPAILID
ncbi:MAG: hypothetical protein IJI65_09230 [Lachnospiraceae bacterium]|nr:hypothetical protein [Lachnospiraceae bacterium]